MIAHFRAAKIISGFARCAHEGAPPLPGAGSLAAGISKHVTYHVSRHTFATMELTMGADLYTTSKLLGHTEVRTTQIYAKIINKKKDEAVSLLDSAFEE